MPPQVPWRDSLAKKLLAQDIEGGVVTDQSDPAEVYKMHDEKILVCEFAKFKRYLHTLVNSEMEKQKQAQIDAEFLANSLKMHPCCLNNARGYPRWDGSMAQKLLKDDVKEGQHKLQKPLELHKTQQLYEQFPPKVFRDHIYQEEHSLKMAAYWADRKANAKK